MILSHLSILSSLLLSRSLQLQRAVQEENSRMGAETDLHHGDHRKMDVCAKSVDLPGGCLRRW